MILAVAPAEKGVEAIIGPERQLASEYEGLRLRQFSSGRHLARTLLASLGCSETAIGRAENGAPEWPEGFTGSLSHSGELVAAVVGKSDEWWGLGIDVEKTGSIGTDLRPLLFTQAESRFLKDLDQSRQDFFTTAFFAVKEAFMKLPSPRPELFEDYRDIEVRWDDGGFTLHGASGDLRVHTGRAFLEAQVRKYQGFVLASIAVES